MNENGINKEIARRNKLFEGKTLAQKRVLVAKDVISLINSRRIVPTSGNWVEVKYSKALGRGIKSYKEEVELLEKISAQKALIAQDVERCKCCGLGSMFVSCTIFRNNVNLYQLDDVDIGIAIKSGETLSNGLNVIFSNTQLSMIEVAFERGKGAFNRSYLLDEDYDNSIAFGKKYRSHKSRLIAIMENIIANKGEFIPKRELK